MALRVKCFVYLFDTPPDCGCTCVVPGSHRWRFGAGDEYYKGQFSGVRAEDGTPKMTEMPGYQKVSCKVAMSGRATFMRLYVFHY